MKRLWLVAESLPLRPDGSPRVARESANLPKTLVPLDPRHGVFPNLVMKPLFAAGFSLAKRHGDQLLDFYREMSAVVADSTDRRFNVFKDRPTRPKKKGTAPESDEVSESEFFEIDESKMAEHLAGFDRENDLWLMFGHQTTFGFLRWLVEGQRPFRVRRKAIGEFSDRFVHITGQISSTHACGTNSQLSRRIGLLHRLCTGADTACVLEQVISTLGPKASHSTEQIVEICRSTVPLLHNEGYQDGSNPTGNAQAHFVHQARGTTTEGDLYWQVMGDAIATRILDEFME